MLHAPVVLQQRPLQRLEDAWQALGRVSMGAHGSSAEMGAAAVANATRTLCDGPPTVHQAVHECLEHRPGISVEAAEAANGKRGECTSLRRVQ